jgi:hypothetical protein
MPGSIIADQVYRGPMLSATSRAARHMVDRLRCRKNLARSIAIVVALVKIFLCSGGPELSLTPGLVGIYSRFTRKSWLCVSLAALASA